MENFGLKGGITSLFGIACILSAEEKWYDSRYKIHYNNKIRNGGHCNCSCFNATNSSIKARSSSVTELLLLVRLARPSRVSSVRL